MRVEPIEEGQICLETRFARSPAKLYFKPPSWKVPIPCRSAGVKKLDSKLLVHTKLAYLIDLQRSSRRGSSSVFFLLAPCVH